MGRHLSGRKILATLLLAASPSLAGGQAAESAARPLRALLPEESRAEALAGRHDRSAQPVFGLEIPDHPAVERRLARYLETEKPGLNQALGRAGRLRRFIAARIAELGLPPELLFLPVLESRYASRAVSKTGAVGLWQIARGTYGAMGLRNDEWLDERRDFWKSTEAALRKLREDRRRFGNWELALAAYNCGSGYMTRVIQSSGIRDFWELRARGLLPRETAEFVPAFFALVRICSTPQRYGLAGGWQEAPRWERVELRRSLDLRLLAEALGVSPETLREANAELKSPITPPPESGYHLKVPAGMGGRVAELLADPNVEWLRFHYHRLQTGDTFYGLSRRYGVSLGLIEQANPGLDPRRLSVGQLVRIPALGAEPATAGSPGGQAAISAAAFSAGYTIQPGDTLWSIARRHGTTAEHLAAANNRSLDDLLKPGETLKVPDLGGGAQ